MASGTIGAGPARFVWIKDTDFTGTSAQDLVDCMNRIDSQLPTPTGGLSCILEIHSSSVLKATILLSRISSQYGGAVVSSYLFAMNGLRLRKNSSTSLWVIQT